MNPREPDHEAHIMLPTGHDMSTDCWCEPVYYPVQDEETDEITLVVEHNDTEPQLHSVVLELRNRNRDWVTVLFDSL